MIKNFSTFEVILIFILRLLSADIFYILGGGGGVCVCFCMCVSVCVCSITYMFACDYMNSCGSACSCAHGGHWMSSSLTLIC